MKATIKEVTESIVTLEYRDFSEANWILNNCESIFSRLASKWETGEANQNHHWLDGYNRECNNRNTFHWACTTQANKYLGMNRLPSDLNCNWERWLERDEQRIFRKFAIKAGSSLLDVLKRRMQAEVDRIYKHEVIKSSYVLCRIIEYPKSKVRKILALEHYDPSLLTLLYGATQGGLEIKDPVNGWKAMPSGKSSYIINGRWLEYIDGSMRATLHRVKSNESQVRRYSLQCFLLLDTDRIDVDKNTCTSMKQALEKIRSHYKNTFIDYRPTERWGREGSKEQGG